MGTADSGEHRGVLGCSGVGQGGVYHRAHWRYGPIPSHRGLTEMCRVAQCAAGALGLDPALQEACPAAPLTTLHPDLRVGRPTPPSLSLGPEPCDQGRPLWSGRGPPHSAQLCLHQANKWSQRISALQMDTHLKIEGKNDIRRLSVGNQGP